jgi:hypothetical protein
MHETKLNPSGAAALSGSRPAAGWQTALADLAGVLWQPLATLRRERNAADVAWLFLVVAGIDFVLSLFLLPTFLHAIAVNAPQLGAGSKVSAIGAALVMSSAINCVIVGFMATLFMLGLMVAEGRANFRALVAALVLATAPLILDRVIRLSAAALIPGRSATDSLLPLSLIFPVPSGELSKVLSYFGLFDLWTFVLVVIGTRFASGGRSLPAILVSILLWGGLQALLLRLHLSGLAG